MRAPLRAGAAGTLWLALPCGLLQSALIVAALASTPWQGAAAMGVFAASSSIGLAAAPALWSRMSARANAWAARACGAALLTASGWALGHGLWERVVALCGG
jgi:sulfite exporter TauE/SafE